MTTETSEPPETVPQSQLVVDSSPHRTPLIYSRIAACIGEIEAVGKDHKNQQQGYSFRAIDDFFDKLQPVLSKYRVFVTPTILSHTREERTTKSGGILMTTLTHVRFRVFTEDGSYIEADALGEGSDSGDKSANKSASQALKYLFMQVFCVRVSSEQNDTERESPAYNAKTPQTNQRAYTMQPERTYQKPAPQANVERPGPSWGGLPPPAERPAATPAAVLPAKATEKTREWAWNQLAAQFPAQTVWDYFVKQGWVPFDGTYDLWPLDHVPTSKQALAALADEIRKTLPAEEKSTVVDSDEMPPEIGSVVISVPRKGQKRADYMASPDTILSLWKGSQEDRKRLFGLKDHYNPEPWIGNDGKKRPPSQADLDCRTGLDLFSEWVVNRKDGDSSVNE